jgi:HD-like signal output (HDOD) protein/prolyl-tRNA editing enzyme YbaK/EbsC (Cys-tRNA(Pro) deacylase)
MSTTKTLANWFLGKGIEPQWWPCDGNGPNEPLLLPGISPAQVLAPVLLESEQRAVMLALVPADRALQIERVNALLQRRFHVADHRRVSLVFFDADQGLACPFAEPYRVPALVDRSLMTLPQVYFRTGREGWVGSVSGEQFRQLVLNHPKVVISSTPSSQAVAAGPSVMERPPVTPAVPLLTPMAAIQKLYRLPPLPGMAMRVLSTVRNPESTVDDLVAILELDPAMCAQILRFAASAHFGYRGRIVSIREAISRVLGFELVGHIAIGIASTKAFIVPREGPLGLRAFWRHALSSAVLCQLIARRLGNAVRFPADTAYLCGLLHNIGVLLWGHLFPADFQRLNQYLTANPRASLLDAEARFRQEDRGGSLLPLTHSELGALLLGTWQLPTPIVAACRFHHEDVPAMDEPCVSIVRLADRMLASRGLGDLGQVPLSPYAGEELGLSSADLDALLLQVDSMDADIGELASALAA